MVNRLNGLPIWGAGHFNVTNKSYVDFELCSPATPRPAKIDLDLRLERAERLLGLRHWSEVVEILKKFKDISLVRPLLVKALTELDVPRDIISLLWPPTTNAEIIIVGGAILQDGTHQEAEEFLRLDGVFSSDDASTKDISQRIRERRLR